MSINLYEHLDALITERHMDVSQGELKEFLEHLIEQGHLTDDYEIDLMEEPWFYRQFRTFLHLVMEP